MNVKNTVSNIARFAIGLVSGTAVTPEARAIQLLAQGVKALTGDKIATVGEGGAVTVAEDVPANVRRDLAKLIDVDGNGLDDRIDERLNALAARLDALERRAA